MDLALGERVALVSGGSRGTGEGIARVLAAEGAAVVVHGFSSGDPDRVVDAIRAAGHRAAGVSGDILSDGGAEEVADAAARAFGRIDVLVNNYGVAEGRGWLDTPTADWVDLYDKNVLSGVRLIRALVPPMRERGWGRVILVGTAGTTRPGARMPHYYAAKSALPSMTVTLARELAGTGITVNTVSPGLVATRELRERFTRLAERRGWGSDWPSVERGVLREVMDNPTGRLGEPEDVGNLVAFLASDRARYVNGANLRIDGGSVDCVS